MCNEYQGVDKLFSIVLKTVMLTFLIFPVMNKILYVCVHIITL